MPVPCGKQPPPAEHQFLQNATAEHAAILVQRRQRRYQLPGTRETSGYSIKVNDVYTGDNALYIDLNLIGPAAGEAVNEVDTYPVIVLKMERREESVVFKM